MHYSICLYKPKEKHQKFRHKANRERKKNIGIFSQIFRVLQQLLWSVTRCLVVEVILSLSFACLKFLRLKKQKTPCNHMATNYDLMMPSTRYSYISKNTNLSLSLNFSRALVGLILTAHPVVDCISAFSLSWTERFYLNPQIALKCSCISGSFLCMD